jgi:hypothetical protein
MKKLFLLIAAVFFYPLLLYSQECLPDGITFTNQAQIDNFKTNHPGCTQIMGNVEISGDDITNLNGLNKVTHFGGMVEIVDNPSLTSLAGLGELTSVYWHLRISGNSSLTSLSGLDKLTWVGGHLEIWRNDKIANLKGLDALTGIGRWLEIGYNPSLLNMDGLDNLGSIGEKFYIQGNNLLNSLTGLRNINLGSVTDLYISDNLSLLDCEIQNICDFMANPTGSINIYNNAPGCNHPHEVAAACKVALNCLPYGNYYFIKQSDIDNFPIEYSACKELSGDITISGNDILSLNGLAQINSVGGSVHIFNSRNLTGLTGLNRMKSIGGSLDIYQDSAMQSFSGLEGLTKIGKRLEIESNPVLTSLSSLGNVNTSLEALHVVYNNKLSNLTGLNRIKRIENICWISFNPSLKSLSGLDSLISVGGSLEIDSNDSLETLAGLDKLTDIKSGMFLWDNPALTSISSLKSLVSIGGAVDIYDNHSLISLSGLENLTTIAGHLWIMTNPLITNLNELKGLTSVGGYLWIWDNANLLNLNGINNINPGSIADLSIALNPLLSTCEAKSVCEYLAGQNGSVEISENSAGCNNPEEVKAACKSVGVRAVGNRQPAVGSFPNPFSELVNIEYTLEKNTTVSLSIFNLYGQEVKLLVNEPQSDGTHLEQWNACGLPEGIYFYRFQAGNQTATGKMILMK